MVPGALIFEAPGLWPLAMAAGAILTAAVLWLYPVQVRAAGPVGWIIPSLRWLAVAVLTLALLKPVILLPRSSQEMGPVVVLLDCSRSMSVTDQGRTPAAQVALAGALGRLPAGTRTDIAAPLADELQRVESRLQEVLGAQSDLDYARVAGRGMSEKQGGLRSAITRYADAARTLAQLAPTVPAGSDLRSLLGTIGQVPVAEAGEEWSRVKDRIEQVKTAAARLQIATDEQLYKDNVAVREACASVSKLSRLQLAEEALLRPDSGLIARLGGNVPVVGMAIDRGLVPFELKRQGKPVEAIAVKAEDNESDLAGAVAAALGGRSRRPVRSVVLFSDGRQVGGRGDVTSSLRPSGTPVLTVGVAPPQPPDAWIANVTLSAASAFAGEMIDGQVVVRYQGVKPPAELHIATSAGEVVEPLRPRVSREGRQGGVELAARFAIPVVPPAGHSAEKIVFSVPPVPGESTSANNRVERWIKVSSDKARVAVCAAAATWDFQYLRGALSRRPWVELSAEVLDAEHPRFGLSAQQILAQDVLVLAGVPVDALDVGQWDAVNTLVTSRGGSVILIAGTDYPIADYARQPVARGLLPFHDVRPLWKQWPGEQPAFHFVPTPAGEQEALRLGDGADGGLRYWQELPGLYRYLQIPDANLFPDVRKLLLESASGSAVLTERRLGAGRVLLLGLNETWRWRLKSGERDADRMWRQLVRHAIGEPVAARQGPLALDLDRVATQPAQTVNVRAQIRGAKSPPSNARSCTIEIVRDGKAIGTRSLPSIGGGQFAGAISDLAEGDYQLRLRATAADGGAVAVHVPLHVAPSDEAEMRNISGDPGMLQRIARSSGGQYFPIDQIGRLPERLIALRDSESQYSRLEIWNSPFMFTFVLACLAGEWALRKRFGLA